MDNSQSHWAIKLSLNNFARQSPAGKQLFQNYNTPDQFLAFNYLTVEHYLLLTSVIEYSIFIGYSSGQFGLSAYKTAFAITQLKSDSEPQAAQTDNLNVQSDIMNINPIYRVYLCMGNQRLHAHTYFN